MEPVQNSTAPTAVRPIFSGVLEADHHERERLARIRRLLERLGQETAELKRLAGESPREPQEFWRESEQLSGQPPTGYRED